MNTTATPARDLHGYQDTNLINPSQMEPVSIRLNGIEEGGGTSQNLRRMILAIDPGTTQSGYVRFDGESVHGSGVLPNDVLRTTIRHHGGPLAIEMISSYGMAVGREVFATCVWIGRFVETYRDPDAVKLIYRRDVKLHLCGMSKAKDANIRQAVIDLFPATGGGKTPQIGTSKQPGPLYGVKSHAWPALAVAITALAVERPQAALELA